MGRVWGNLMGGPDGVPYRACFPLKVQDFFEDGVKWVQAPLREYLNPEGRTSPTPNRKPQTQHVWESTWKLVFLLGGTLCQLPC